MDIFVIYLYLTPSNQSGPAPFVNCNVHAIIVAFKVDRSIQCRPQQWICAWLDQSLPHHLLTGMLRAMLVAVVMHCMPVLLEIGQDAKR